MPEPLLLSLGSINADFQVRTPRPLQAGETLTGENFTALGGGKAANVALLARQLGHSAALFGRVGDDTLRHQALHPVQAAGVALEGVTIAPDAATAVAMIAVPPDGHKSIVLAGNANDCWDDAARARLLAAIHDAPSGSVLSVDLEISPEVARQAVRQARARGLTVLLDPAPAIRAEDALLAQCHALTPDAREAAELTGMDIRSVQSAAKAARQLARLGPELVCIKRRDGGCVVAQPGRTWRIDPVPVEVVDATGAGDAFTGALAVALLERMPAARAVRFATAASHLAVTQWGSHLPEAPRPAIEALARRLEDRMHDIPA